MFLKLRHIILSIFILSTPIYRAQLVAYYSSTNFNTPQNKPYLDCNITFIASSLASKKTNNGFQQSLQIIQKIYNDTLLIICRNQYGLNAERGVEDYYPIPLTEEWMVRFGFKEWTGWYYLKLKSLGDEFTLCYAPNEDLLMLNIGEKTIKYENPKVHQLQNLVFALEGVELEMK